MTHIENLLRRNESFARTGARQRVPNIPFIPNQQAYVITCIDPASTLLRSSASTSVTRSPNATSAVG